MTTVDTQLQATSYTPDPVLADLREIDGALITDDWIDAQILRGRGWQINIGDLTTPIRGGGAGTVFDEDQPELIVDIPKGTTCIPLRMHMQGEVVLGAADDDFCEYIITVDRTAINDAFSGSTETIEVPLNMRTDIIGGCPLTVASAVTGNITAAPTRSMELMRHVVGFDVAIAGTPTETFWQNFDVLYEPKTPPMIVGPATLNAYWGTNISGGFSAFMQVSLLAIPSETLVELA